MRKTPLDTFKAHVAQRAEPPRPQGRHRGFYFAIFLCLPVLVLACVWLFLFFPTGERVVAPPSPPPPAIVPERPALPAPVPVSAPAPSVKPTLNLTAQLSLSLPATNLAKPEVTVAQDEAWPLLPSHPASKDGDPFVRYLDRRDGPAAKFLFFRAPEPGDDHSLILGRLRTGYGTLFRDDSRIFRGRNGTAWEEPGTLYVKITFPF